MTDFNISDLNISDFNISDFNLTETEKIIAGIAYRDGQKMGKILADAIKSGELILPENQTMEIIINEFNDFVPGFTASQKLLLKLFSPNNCIAGNFIFAGGGIVIGGSAFVNFYKTQNRIAKTCYIVSGLCGGTAAIAGTYSAVTSYFGLSILATGGDIFGGSFLYLGNKANKLGNYLEGEKRLNRNLFRPRNFLRRPVSKRGMGLGYKGMGFVTPAPLDIPFETILTVGGTALTIYSYSKIMIAIYRYINKKFSPKIDHSLRVYSQARFIIDSFSELEPVKKELEHIKKVNRIYYAALRL